jgi:hypothetical protein
VKDDELAKPAIKAVRTNKIVFIPERFRKPIQLDGELTRTGASAVKLLWDIAYPLGTAGTAAR